MEKLFFEAGDYIKDEYGNELYCLMAPAIYNDKYYVVHAREISSNRECLLKFAETNDDSYKLNNLKREGDFCFFYPYIERVYGNFSGITPIGEKIYGVELEFIHGRNLKDFRVDLERKVFLNMIDEETAEWIIYRQIMQFLYGMRYYTEYSKQTYLHRDIKPENVMITDGEENVIIVDFDFAHIAGSERTVNLLGWDLAFSSGYTSPDIFKQRKRGERDISTDIYSAGRLFFYWINGRNYFTEEQLKDGQEEQLSSTVYCMDKKIGYGIETNKNRFNKKYLSDKYTRLRNILDKMCCNPDENQPYSEINEIISDMKKFLLSLCEGSLKKLENCLQNDNCKLLYGSENSLNKRYTMVVYKTLDGIKVGQPLYENTIRDINFRGKYMFSICNFDNIITYIPSFGRTIEIRRNNQSKYIEKDKMFNDYEIYNGDIVICDGISFEFTIV